MPDEDGSTNTDQVNTDSIPVPPNPENKDTPDHTEWVNPIAQQDADNPSGDNELTGAQAFQRKLDEKDPQWAPSETPLVKRIRGTPWQVKKAEKSRIRALKLRGMSMETRKGHGISVQNEGLNLVIRCRKAGINASALEREIARIVKQLLG